MATKARYKPRNATVGNNSRAHLLVALYRFYGLGVGYIPVVVDGVRRIYSVLGWTSNPRYAFTIRACNRLKKTLREN